MTVHTNTVLKPDSVIQHNIDRRGYLFLRYTASTRIKVAEKGQDAGSRGLRSLFVYVTHIHLALPLL